MSTYPENQPQEPQLQTIREPDPLKIQHFMEQIREEQNLTLGIAAGAIAALLGSVLWGVISYVTNYQIGWMAIGVAFMVGWSIRTFGKGVDKVFGFAGAGLALFSCILGNFLMFAAVISREYEASLLDVLFYMLTNPAADLEIFIASFSVIDLLFYAFAIYYGYQYSFRRITAEEQEGLYRTRTIVQ